jgi:glycine/D-amino acid oxidase-like deaminating enzyme
MLGYSLLGRAKSSSDDLAAEMLDADFRPVPYWWDDLGEVPKAEEELTDDNDAIVVGAGFAGMSAARTLAAHGARTLVIEAKSPFYGASSRNCGFFGQLFERGLDLSQPAGLQEFQEYGVINDFLREMIKEDGVDVNMRFGRYRAASHAAHLPGMIERMRKTSEKHEFRYEVISAKDEKGFFNSTLSGHGGVFLPDAPFLQPAKLAYGNYLGTRRAGAKFAGNTAVTDVKRDSSGSYIVETSRGTVTARKVLIAVGGYGPRGFDALKVGALPMIAHQIATTPLTPEQMRSVMKQPMSAINTNTNFYCISPSPDGQRLLICGRTGVRYASERDMAADMTRLSREIFPQLGQIRATHGWHGEFAMTIDHRPHVFEDEDKVTYVTGDNGSGIGRMQWLGHKAALRTLGLEGSNTVYASAGVPRFPGYFGGSDWFVPGAVALFDLRDKYDLF